MKKKWVKRRHKRIYNFYRNFFLNKYKKQFNFTYDKIDDKNEPHLVLCNHQTGIDQFLVGQVFANQAYFVCTDDIMTIPFLSKLLKWALNPIPYKKASTDLTFLRTCRQVVKEGGSIMIFPEGNRTYRGITEYINPTISKMIKFLGIPVDIMNLHGGFGAFPRFSDDPRKGTISLKLKRTISKEEIKELSDEDLNKIINTDLYVNEYENNPVYYSKKSAEYIERVIYRCPKCGLSKFSSKGRFFHCNNCAEDYEYLDNLTLSENAPFRTISDWYNYQTKELLENPINNYPNDLLFEDDVTILKVIPRKIKKKLDKKGHIKFFKDHVELKIKKKIISIDLNQINSTGVFGKNKVNLFLDDITYQLKGNKQFNGLKYVHFIYKDKIEKGVVKNDYLGI